MLLGVGVIEKPATTVTHELFLNFQGGYVPASKSGATTLHSVMGQHVLHEGAGQLASPVAHSEGWVMSGLEPQSAAGGCRLSARRGSISWTAPHCSNSNGAQAPGTELLCKVYEVLPKGVC